MGRGYSHPREIERWDAIASQQRLRPKALEGPTTERQRRYLRHFGVAERKIPADKASASAMIDRLKRHEERKGGTEPAR